MDADQGRPVLAIADFALRSALSAQLAMADEMPISTTNYLDRTLTPAVRAQALLIVEDRLIESEPAEWIATLHGHGWVGDIIIVTDNQPSEVGDDPRVTLVGRRNAARSLMTLARLWRSSRRTNRSE